MAPKRGRSALVLSTCIALLGLGGSAQAAGVTFSTFINGTDISNAIGQDNTIGITYAGNKFVGSVYVGGNNGQLYQSNLSGTGVTAFGSALPGADGETVLAASLGQAGFAKGNIFASPGGTTSIYQYANCGGTPTLFASIPTGQYVRQIFFDPGSSFGGDMLVTTNAGNIYKVTSAGAVSFLASTGEDTEGMDIASSKFGKYAGQLLTTSEGSGTIRAISAGGTITVLENSSGAPLHINEAETVSVVPLNFGVSGNPLEGFYVANYPVDIQKAGVTSQFASYLGDAIVTEEDSVNSPLWDISYNSTGDYFSLSEIGMLPDQSEDGFFLTAQRITDVGVAAAARSWPDRLKPAEIGSGAFGRRFRFLATALGVAMPPVRAGRGMLMPLIRFGWAQFGRACTCANRATVAGVSTRYRPLARGSPSNVAGSCKWQPRSQNRALPVPAIPSP